jgi:hypothetical protein
LIAALVQLHARLAPHGLLLLFIPPKNWITKLLIENGGRQIAIAMENCGKRWRRPAFKQQFSGNFPFPTSG